MNNIQVFNNPEFGDIRTVEIDGEVFLIYWCVCMVDSLDLR